MKKIVGLIWIVIFTIATHASVLRVPLEYQTIQAGINASANGDTVLVSNGFYQENITFLGKNISVKSENGAAFCTIDSNQNGPVVLFNNGETSDSILDGFTIQNGTGFIVERATNGGGITCWYASPSIVRCVIQNNSADWGGGMRVWYSSPTITSCIFRNNYSPNDGGGLNCTNDGSQIYQCYFINNQSGWGGGLYCYEGTTFLLDCEFLNNLATVGGGIAVQKNHITADECVISGGTIRSNTATDRGGGVYCYSSSPTIQNCEIFLNQAGPYGGGICLREGSEAIISECNIYNNTATNGGGIYVGADSNDSSFATIIDCNITDNNASHGGGIVCANGQISNCQITNNHSDTGGGGLYCNHSTSLAVTNCLISENSSGQYGGGLYFNYSDLAALSFVNCSIVYNISNSQGGALSSVDSPYPSFSNCILWGNVAPEYDEIHIASGTELPVITYSDIAGDWTGEGNIDTDPLFIYGPSGNYYLSQISAGQAVDSPCCNTGNTQSENICFNTTTDQVCLSNLTTRTDQTPDTGIVDMGYHYDTVTQEVPTITTIGILTLLLGLGMFLFSRQR